MRNIGLILLICVSAGCAQYPTREAQPGEALVLIKPVIENVHVGGETVPMRHELAVLGSHDKWFRKKSRAHTAEFFPAGKKHVNFFCTIKGETANSESSQIDLRAGACYAPRAMGTLAASPENDAIYHAQIIAGRQHRPYDLTSCVIELKEVDCTWLKTEMKSGSVGYQTPPVWSASSIHLGP